MTTKLLNKGEKKHNIELDELGEPHPEKNLGIAQKGGRGSQISFFFQPKKVFFIDASLKCPNVRNRAGQIAIWARGVYSSLFRYNHTDKKLLFFADFIKN